jgi:hypothetical protein
MSQTPTRVTQRQIRKSDSVNDTFQLPSYGDVTTLEGDLNYLRSILKALKGTSSYDTPLTITLSALETGLANMLDGATLNNVVLSGEPTAAEPMPGDDSSRIATTSFVRSVVSGSGAAGDKYVRVVKDDPSILEWVVNHGMNKKPSVTFVDSSKRENEVSVTYIDTDSLIINFSYQVSGILYLN